MDIWRIERKEMHCEKKQAYCSWMRKKCDLPPQVAICDVVIEKCHGCEKVLPSGYCSTYPDTGLKWRKGNCPSATHLKKTAAVEKKVNPLKASKKGAKK